MLIDADVFIGATHTAVDHNGNPWLTYHLLGTDLSIEYCYGCEVMEEMGVHAGTEGQVVREGQKKVSNACGAIEAILGEIRSNVQQNGTIRDDNVEYDTLKKQIFSEVSGSIVLFVENLMEVI